MTTRKHDLQSIAERMIEADPKMRFVGIIDLGGNIVEGIMKKGKSSLQSQREEEHFCKQVAQRRKMRTGFNRSLGKVRYVHVEREKVSQLVVYARRYTVFATVEPELSIVKKIQLVNRIKRITSQI